MLFLFSVVFGTLGAALGKVGSACPARCVSEGLLNGQHLVRVGTYSDLPLIPRVAVAAAPPEHQGIGCPYLVIRSQRLEYKHPLVMDESNEADFGRAYHGVVGLEAFP